VAARAPQIRLGQEQLLAQDVFVAYVNQLYSENAVLEGDIFDPHHGVDLQILRDILARLGVNLRDAAQHPRSIGELPGFAEDKSAAIQAFVGQATWVIVAVIREVPSPSNSEWRTTLQAGHYVALRKDSAGQWWLLDSVSRPAMNIPLAILHQSLVLLVPALH
jgi:hypothetical protein